MLSSKGFMRRISNQLCRQCRSTQEPDREAVMCERKMLIITLRVIVLSSLYELYKLVKMNAEEIPYHQSDQTPPSRSPLPDPNHTYFSFTQHSMSSNSTDNQSFSKPLSQSWMNLLTKQMPATQGTPGHMDPLGEKV